MNGGDLRRFRDDIHNYKFLKKNFAYRQYGGTAFIYMGDGRVYIYGDHTEDRGKGYHICRYVKEDVEAWIKNNPNFDYEKYSKADYKEQLFNLKKIISNIDKPMVGIDINNCYFQTGRNLGYITERVFNMGCKKMDDWKLGRNSSIGSLAKIETIVLYVNGEVKYRKNYGSKKEKELAMKKRAIRNHIIGHVWNMFLELIEKRIRNDYYMFLTDCIYTDSKNIKIVQDFFTEKGYDSKFKQYVLRGVDREQKIIAWWDYVKEKDKWYHYADHQLHDYKAITV